jgi:hypothetical protein
MDGGPTKKIDSEKHRLIDVFEKYFFKVATPTTPEKPVNSALQKVWSASPVAKSKVPSKKIDPEKHGLINVFGKYFSRSRHGQPPKNP